jgi:hypothetical protein
MPITGPSSYPAVIGEFLGHWEAVNAVVGGLYGIGLQGGIMREDLVALQGELEAKRDAVTDAGVDRSLARAQLDVLIAKLQGKMVEFNRRVRADFAGTPYERALPVAFSVGDAEAAVRETLRHMGRVWEKINQISPAPAGVAMPLVLLGGYSRANFDLDRTALRMAYRALGDAQVDLKLAREVRNDLQDRIYEVLKIYRLKIPTALPEGHALLDALPALTPPTGHTPSPVAVQGVWDAGAQKAKITWAASAEAEVREYEVRGVPGDDYQAEDEEVLATFGPEEAREFLTDFALGAPEVTAGYKVYVVLESGNERGSEAVFVTRPG